VMVILRTDAGFGRGTIAICEEQGVDYVLGLKSSPRRRVLSTTASVASLGPAARESTAAGWPIPLSAGSTGPSSGTSSGRAALQSTRTQRPDDSPAFVNYPGWGRFTPRHSL
jgi:hypothetical protein